MQTRSFVVLTLAKQVFSLVYCTPSAWSAEQTNQHILENAASYLDDEHLSVQEALTMPEFAIELIYPFDELAKTLNVPIEHVGDIRVIVGKTNGGVWTRFFQPAMPSWLAISGHPLQEVASNSTEIGDIIAELSNPLDIIEINSLDKFPSITWVRD